MKEKRKKSKFVTLNSKKTEKKITGKKRHSLSGKILALTG